MTVLSSVISPRSVLGVKIRKTTSLKNNIKTSELITNFKLFQTEKLGEGKLWWPQ
jgi:hypothetical protein